MTVLTVLAQTDTIPMTKIVPQRLPDLNIPRFCHDTFYANGELTVTGGHTSNFVPTPTAEFLKDGKWQVLQMAYTHDDGLCVPLRNGKVLLAGGYEKNLGVGQTIEAELYDPATHTFEGFGCLDRRRTQVSGIELPSGQVVAAGNWYHPDAIETYDGGMYFETARDVSLPRSRPYLFRTSDGDVMVISGCWDNYGKPITSNIVDRLNGEPFRVPLLDAWKPYLLGHTPRSDDSFIGDDEKGDCAYLLPVQDSTGQVAIAEVRDKVFSLLPTTVPVPMKSRFGEISYYTAVIVDRQLQRGYIIGVDSLPSRQYVLAVDYAQEPAGLTLYYTDTLEAATTTIPVVTPEGDLILAGGIQKDNYKPMSAVWLYHFATDPASSLAPLQRVRETVEGRELWVLVAVVVAIAVLAYIYIVRRKKRPGRQVSDDELMERILQLIEEDNRYLKNLRLSDIANDLGVSAATIAECIRNNRGCTLAQLLAEYRVRHAQKLITDNPELKLAVVIAESGFTSESTFFRTFKAVTGKSPKEWLLGQ